MMNTEFEKIVKSQVEKARHDEDFKSRLIKNPRKALGENLDQFIKEEEKIEVVDCPDFTSNDYIINRYEKGLLIKVPPQNVVVNAELTDDQLEAVAGGNFMLADLAQKIDQIRRRYSTPPPSD